MVKISSVDISSSPELWRRACVSPLCLDYLGKVFDFVINANCEQMSKIERHRLAKTYSLYLRGVFDLSEKVCPDDLLMNRSFAQHLVVYRFMCKFFS